MLKLHAGVDSRSREKCGFLAKTIIGRISTAVVRDLFLHLKPIVVLTCAYEDIQLTMMNLTLEKFSVR